MDSEVQRLGSRRSQIWFTTKKFKNGDAANTTEVSDGNEAEDSSSLRNTSVIPRAVKLCGLTHELRIFVGTWNVAGRTPVGSLAMDMDKWLNLKSSVDIYVLGFQEVVPLNTLTVIGLEDHTETTKWNLLIGKTLNNKDGCVWLTPTLALITSEDYQYEKGPDASAGKSLRPRKNAMTQRSKTLHGGESGGSGSSYKLMASKKMVGVFITVWMKREVLKKYKVSNVKVCTVACGLMGYLGNKGSASVSMSIEGTSFCFTTAHLASGEKKGDEVRRNQQVLEILRRSVFPRVNQENDNSLPSTILGHDRIFWFGDLNYRLCMEDDLARELIRKKNWKQLQIFDQLKKEKEEGGVFQGWKEGDLEFAPTYKYSVGFGNLYTGEKHAPFVPSSAEKRRTPAWCDRILWFGKGIELLSYVRGESKFSDHRPVSALFSTEIEVLTPPNQKDVV